MNVKFDAKSNTLTIEGFSINPKSTAASSTGKTFILGTDRVKTDIDGREATVSVMAYVYAKTKGKK